MRYHFKVSIPLRHDELSTRYTISITLTFRLPRFPHSNKVCQSDIFVGPPGTGKICLSKYSLCCRSSIQRISSGGVLMKPKYALTEVFTLYLVPDSFKHSAKPQPHVLTLSFFSTKMTKLDKVIFIEILSLPF